LRDNPNDTYIGMTLQEDNENVPGWRKSRSFINNHPQIQLENGVDGTGNILSLANFEHCRQKYGGSMHFITADGGFDFTENFNNQERDMLRLLFAQICFALSMQAYGGHFILKIFDFYLPATLDLIYLLSSFYERVYIVKPDTSRAANSEKYLVCIHYNHESFDPCYESFHHVFDSMIQCRGNIARFLESPLSYYFSNKLEEYNCCFGQQQIENIHTTLQLIYLPPAEQNNKIQYCMKNNIAKCEHWCNKFNV
jgi:23S rRNA U2552 (ribose-2'-O)-methylase RlmE/FtsJ